MKKLIQIVSLYSDCRRGRKGMNSFISFAEMKALRGATPIESFLLDAMYIRLVECDTPFIVI